MRLLLDTHALIWWLNEDPRLSGVARDAIADRANDIYASSVSAFEITNKFRLGKLNEARLLAQNFIMQVSGEGFEILALDAKHGQHAGLLEIPHRDPFDRLLIAQAEIEGMTLVSNEALFDGFGVRRLW